jgi:hypothetical protein
MPNEVTASAGIATVAWQAARKLLMQEWISAVHNRHWLA